MMTGSSFFPDTRAFFDEFSGPYIGDDFEASDIPPIWNPEFFGNTIIVNGNTWPTLDVQPRRYRFRFLNGCNSRFVILRTTTDDSDRSWLRRADGRAGFRRCGRSAPREASCQLPWSEANCSWPPQSERT